MIKDRRRIIIIIISVLIGTFLSTLLLIAKRGKISGNDVFMLATNFAFALAIVVVIGVVLKRSDKKNEKKI